MLKHAIHWFEIPTQDLARATRFYETVLDVKLKPEDMGPMKLALFPREGDEAVAGALLFDGRRKPSGEGALVYLNADGKLDACLARVAKAGGQIALPKTDIGDPGFIAIVVDTEGNSVGLHAERPH